MPKVTVFDMAGKKVSDMELKDTVFGIEPNKAVMHAAVVNFLANQRQGTQSTLTRSEVRGGGRKPWRQKGTGHASPVSYTHLDVYKRQLLLIGVYVLGNLFQWVLTYTSATVSYGMGKGLRHDMFAKLRRLPLRFFDRTPHGDVVSRFMTDVEQLCDCLLYTSRCV